MIVRRSGSSGPDATRLSAAEVWDLLDTVMDPEVPVLSVVELGIIRDVKVDERGTTVVITPTYSGCPAMRVIEDDIRAALVSQEVGVLRLETTFNPAWTTDWMSDDAKTKLRAYGIAPPAQTERNQGLVTLSRRAAIVCPVCGSMRTTVKSEFGSTACKAINYCEDCRQPFEAFKSI